MTLLSPVAVQGAKTDHEKWARTQLRPSAPFFGLLQNNVLNRRTWATREQLRIAIVTWIERTYHRRRRQRTLSRLTPIEYETIMTPPASQAA
jgi:transposase InsO family protein